MGNPPGFTADQSLPGRRGRYGNMKHYRPPMSPSHGALPASWVQLSQATASTVEDEDDVTGAGGPGAGFDEGNVEALEDDAGFDEDAEGVLQEVDEDGDPDDDLEGSEEEG